MKKLSIYIALVLAFGTLRGGVALAQPTTTGTWELFPEQATAYTTAVQQPINADGTSNFKFTGKNVIPIKFSVSTEFGPVILQSIGSDASTDNDFSFLSFTPGAQLTFNQITNLITGYTFSEGNCHGGALRWSVRVSATQSVFIYYGASPNFTDCTSNGPATNQSAVNMINRPELRYDTSQIAGGTFYDSYAHALTLVGSMPIVRASLVLDGGWAGDQVINPVVNAAVNDNIFVPLSGGGQTCDLPPATIQITQISGSATEPVNEPISIQPVDSDSQFRVVDCKYMYNLATASLPGTGRYKVEVVIDGNPAAGAAFFDLR
jgi:hypothetical protein